ncbi:hypothetical protein Ae168Ps1_3946c [Pseudonocardia sp. Ae168_Ps1]|nr:hypothetical protein Ae150APs1_3923c [Pseudonocardia sp. Ae150A_Ps1]OLL81540.1 hypothetical protein Ae168Ps1_3946c [Pseudonocardia sp. Ae168_Ps1]OLL84347.1 hypothetical protein Ae263Ps1_1402 [Pseudonocardia sp. Ae263_Ps1]OLL95635.1 hypothetical protein Ae356Ps1_5532c [Pseudonocardia sp. Ae356_Ps1]
MRLGVGRGMGPPDRSGTRRSVDDRPRTYRRRGRFHRNDPSTAE